MRRGKNTQTGLSYAWARSYLERGKGTRILDMFVEEEGGEGRDGPAEQTTPTELKVGER